MTESATPFAAHGGGAPRRIHLLEVVGNAIVGGMETHVLRLVERLPGERFRVSALVPFEGPFADRLRALGADVQVVAMAEELSWTSLQTATALVRQAGIDVLHAHMAHAHQLAALAGRLTGRPVLSTIHARQLSVLDIEVQRSTGSHLSAVCRQTYWHALGLGLAPERVHCIPNGVDAALFKPGPAAARGLRHELGIAADLPLVGCVARLSPEKGIDVFLRTALALRDALPAAHCVLVGDGPLRDEAADFIARHALGARVHLAGERADMPALYRELDLLLSTSHSEALPLVLLEAMASALPVVATRTGGVAELVAHGVTGWLVAPRDSESAAARVAQALGTPGERERMGAAARERVLERFGIAPSVEQTARLLERLAQGEGEQAVPRLGAVEGARRARG